MPESIAAPVVEVLPVVGAHSIAHLLPRSKGRCGIYVLRFANEDRYVGQAVDVVSRFADHRRTYPDIVEVTFWRVPLAGLDSTEQGEIRRLETQGLPLRNVVHTSGRLGASDFDIVVTPNEQQCWLESPRSDTIDEDSRPQHPVLRRGNHPGFQRLMRDPRFAEVQFALRRYVAWTVPEPRRTEVSYWSISANPGTAGRNRLFTMSVHALETLFVYAPRDDLTITGFRMNVDLALLLKRWGTLSQLKDYQPGIHVDVADYSLRAGVAWLWAPTAREFVLLLGVDAVVPAARRLNLDLMRKGPALNWKSHCLDLADLILEPHPSEDPVPDEALMERGLERVRQGRFDDAEVTPTKPKRSTNERLTSTTTTSHCTASATLHPTGRPGGSRGLLPACRRRLQHLRHGEPRRPARRAWGR